MNKTPNTTYTLPVHVSHPIPIPQNETPKQYYDDDEICGSFHEHSIKCNPILIARSLAFEARNNESNNNTPKHGMFL